ncbi:dihydrolipoamide acetyltransferase family protein [Flammeovirga kamogawensis]|uniref:Dihydrolipoamide acetyltransferase component of pyruvate dehydrogenase complex n=1 Tax=Flammeovirga kamogawensis TaxID=373891 RepID=A0ABX8GR26_9BACT|nr:dihydrolipoamide acetyltransferase family protein [Flammeovirga kamogawensis]MBB6463099.1 2-oxoglutarate dehydrogenase E2 component (dihydrolipoamide succinyltransferase) [Flammeovirga kamogawensis]QWG05732.1 2-oxo acid dehydrogenase subunit E2 [Flammeovirga kamogawensis]TRX67560.1 2-oxo acid dehydrogenase subunit E2 [Flammeovirga kamogawensis]
MAQVEMVLPAMGEGIMEATVLEWLKEEGDSITLDESVVEVATDKVDTEVPATVEGIIKKILVTKDDVVQIGAAIAIVEIAGDDATEAEPTVTTTNNTVENAAVPTNNTDNTNGISAKSGNRFYSPLVRNIAKKEGISQEVLDGIPGTGKEGRVTKKDMLDFLENGVTTPVQTTTSVQKPPAPSVSSAPKVSTPPPAVSLDNGDEVIEMDRVRKMIADRMIQSKQTAPHVTSCVEADMTNVVLWRTKSKEAFKKQEGANLTFMPIIISAIAKAIKEYPMINVQVDGSNIIVKKDINIGMAVAMPNGNLIVPVIRNADRLSLSGLALKIQDLSIRARENKLKPEELSGGTYTVSNIGSFGNTIGTPIIMQPQVAIMAIGTIRKKPAVIETPQGDVIGIRQFAYFSHSYDHRVVDGALGGMFVRKVADILEQWDLDLSI